MTLNSGRIEELEAELVVIEKDSRLTRAYISEDQKWFDEATLNFPLAKKLGISPRTPTEPDYLSKIVSALPNLRNYSNIRNSDPLSIVSDLTNQEIWTVNEPLLFRLINLESLLMKRDEYRGLVTQVLDQNRNLEKLVKALNRSVQLTERQLFHIRKPIDRNWFESPYEPVEQDLNQIEIEVQEVRRHLTEKQLEFDEQSRKVSELKAQIHLLKEAAFEFETERLFAAGIESGDMLKALEAWFLELPNKTAADLSSFLSGDADLQALITGLWKSRAEIQYCWECLETSESSFGEYVEHLGSTHVALPESRIRRSIQLQFSESWNLFGLDPEQQEKLMNKWVADRNLIDSIRVLVLGICPLDRTTRHTHEDLRTLNEDILPGYGITRDKFSEFLSQFDSMFERIGVRKTVFIQWFSRLPASLERDLIAEAIKNRGLRNELQIR